MFKERDQYDGNGGGGAALSRAPTVHDRGSVKPREAGKPLSLPRINRISAKVRDLDLVTDLGSDIGTPGWWRGLATLGVLVVAAWATGTGNAALPYAASSATDRQAWEEMRSQGISPIALGSNSGRRMAATARVVALKETPDRPRVEVTSTFRTGDDLERLLRRAGMAGDDATSAAAMIAGASELSPGSEIAMVLGRRTSKTAPRPLDALTVRARFDLELRIARSDAGLSLTEVPILVDETPLRIRGLVGSSLYRSARAAGAPAKAIEAYLRVIGKELDVASDIGAEDEFDIVVDYKRAETGEIEVGNLRYAGLISGGAPRLRMMAWDMGGKQIWFNAKGVGAETGGLVSPVAGRRSSNFGMRKHPILGYKRMHSGVDYGARSGTPIVAVTDGRVTYAGRKGGYGRFVRLSHAGGLGSGYAHMSRIAVNSGERVKRGQVIGYVGSTGLSTGPHLHFEMYQGSRTVNPATVKYSSRPELSGRDLDAFRAQLSRIGRVEPGAALAPLAPTRALAANQEAREAGRLPGG